MTSSQHHQPLFSYKCKHECFIQTLPPLFFNWSFSPAVPQPAAASPLKLLPIPDAKTGQLPKTTDNQHLPAQ